MTARTSYDDPFVFASDLRDFVELQGSRIDRCDISVKTEEIDGVLAYSIDVEITMPVVSD